MKAIISDIHSNIEALEAVLKDIDSKGITEIICLGDVVGYGPNPNECLDRALRFDLTILGNHDDAVTGSAAGFTEAARKAIDWTREEIQPKWLSSHKKKKEWKFLTKMPFKHKEDQILLVHGSPREPTTEYILRSDCDQLIDEPSEKIQENFSLVDYLCFVGHTHDPGVIVENEYKFLTPEEIDNSYEAKEGAKAIINVGSVGQPRDGDPRSCYVTFDGKFVNYHRVEYDYNITREKILQIEGLDNRFGERLAVGH